MFISSRPSTALYILHGSGLTEIFLWTLWPFISEQNPKPISHCNNILLDCRGQLLPFGHFSWTHKIKFNNTASTCLTWSPCGPLMETVCNREVPNLSATHAGANWLTLHYPKTSRCCRSLKWWWISQWRHCDPELDKHTFSLLSH